MKKIANLNLENLKIREQKLHFSLPGALASDVEKIWEKKVAQAKVSGRQLWNGQVYRLDGFEQVHVPIRQPARTTTLVFARVQTRA